MCTEDGSIVVLKEVGLAMEEYELVTDGTFAEILLVGDPVDITETVELLEVVREVVGKPHLLPAHSLGHTNFPFLQSVPDGTSLGTGTAAFMTPSSYMQVTYWLQQLVG